MKFHDFNDYIQECLKEIMTHINHPDIYFIQAMKKYIWNPESRIAKKKKILAFNKIIKE